MPTRTSDPGGLQRIVGGGTVTIATATTTAGVQTVTDANCSSDSVITLTPTNNAAILAFKHGISVVPSNGSFAVFVSATAADGTDGGTFSYVIVENQF